MGSRVKIAIRAAAFFAALIGVHINLRHFYLDRVHLSAIGRQVFRERASSPDPIDVVFAGNSHMLAACSRNSLPRSYVMATSGEPHLATYYRLRYFLEKRPTPVRAVVLQLDFRSFRDSRAISTKSTDWAILYDHMEIALHRREAWPVLADWIVFDAVPYAGRIDEFWKYLMTKRAAPEAYLDALAGQRFDRVENKEKVTYLLAKKNLTSAIWYEKESEYYLEQIIRLCREHGTKFVWVRIPLSRSYYDNVSAFIPLDEWDAKVKAVLNRNPDIIFLDGNGMFFGRDELFSDGNHLNYDGSAAFMTWIQGELARASLLATDPAS